MLVDNNTAVSDAENFTRGHYNIVDVSWDHVISGNQRNVGKCGKGGIPHVGLICIVYIPHFLAATATRVPEAQCGQLYDPRVGGSNPSIV